MATPNDQPRPDLDAAVDGLLPSLTAVSEERTARSCQRTRTALAETGAGRPAWAWRWALPAGALAVLALAIGLWWPSAPPEAPRVVSNARPRSAPASSAPRLAAPAAVVSAASPAPAPVQPRRMPLPRVTATSVPTSIETGLPVDDPIVALSRAVREIPEEAWTAALARSEGSIEVVDLSVPPIVVPPLVTPPIANSPALPVQGEP